MINSRIKPYMDRHKHWSPHEKKERKEYEQAALQETMNKLEMDR